MQTNKATQIKARLSNLLRTELFPYSENEYEVKFKKKKKLGDQDKLLIFNKVFAATKEMDIELRRYKSKRRHKAVINEKRLNNPVYQARLARKAENKKKNLALAK